MPEPVKQAQLKRGKPGYIPVDPKVGAILALVMGSRLAALQAERDSAKEKK